MRLNQLKLLPFAPLLFAIYGFFLLATSGNWGVIETSEARYAEIAREMLQTGDWIHPRLLNIFHFHKPPLTYWITALSYKVFGVNPFAARFFLQISLLWQVFLIYKITRHLFPQKKIALLASVIYSTLPLVIVSVRGLTTDIFLTTCVLLVILFWLLWRKSGSFYWLYLLAIAASMGFLIKGPLILIFPLFIWLGFNKLLPSRAMNWHHFLATVLFLGMAFSWYGVLVAENEKLMSYFLFRQTFERVTQADVFSRHQPFWYYLLYSPLLALPWSAVLLVHFVRRGWLNQPIEVRRITVFWILVPVIFFSLVSSKLVLYILPVFPGVAIIAAHAVFNLRPKSRLDFPVLVYFIVLLLTCCFVSLFGFDFLVKLLIIPVAGIVTLLTIRVYATSLEKDRMVVYAYVFALVIFCYGDRFLGRNELRLNASKPLAEWIKSQGYENRNVMVYNRILPSLAFHLNRSIISLDKGNKNLNREIDFEKDDRWKNFVYNLEDEIDKDRLVPLLKDSPVLIVKGEVFPSSRWILPYFNHKKEFEGWSIYF